MIATAPPPRAVAGAPPPRSANATANTNTAQRSTTWPASPLSPLSPMPDGGEGSDVSELLAACNAYVDNIVSENQRMRSKLLTCRQKLGPLPPSF